MGIWRFMVAFLVLTTMAKLGTAQQFGGNPPSLKWKQINSDTVRVIFPAGLDQQAEDIATIIHRLASTTQPTIGQQLRKVNIVLQNQTTNANGYVQLGPFRSEFFLTPRQNSFELGSLPWHKMLALHEYRHVQQFNNFRHGISKVFYIFFGEEGLSLANSVAIPDWFWEGDAVYQETLESRQGRGRLPFFFNDYRSIWASGKNYSYMKLRNGSYLDQTPDHYRLGYMLVNYGRENYGEDTWGKITGDAAAYKGLFYPFQRAVKKYTGESFTDFTRNALKSFKTASPGDMLSGGKDSAASFGRQHQHFFADEEYPQWAGDENIIYVRSSYKRIPVFYMRNTLTGTERKIRIKDISIDNYFSYRNGRIIYSAYQPDIRWGWKDYGVIKLADIKTGRQKTLTSKTKYLSPDISADGSSIIAVHASPGGATELHLLTSDGKLSAIVPNPERLTYTYPKFYHSGKAVVAARNASGEMALGIIDLHTGGAQWLTPFSMQVIGFPQVKGDTICFSAADGKQDKLYAVAGGRLFTFESGSGSQSTGNYQLSINNNKYAFISYTAVGYHLRYGSLTAETFLESSPVQSLSSAEDNLKGKTDFLKDSGKITFPVSGYPKSFRLFNFHSWRPYIADPEYSYSLVSQNVLNTLQSEFFATYNRNEHFTQVGASMAYGGLFPLILGGASYTFNRTFRDSAFNVNWNEVNASLALSVPLNFSSGRYRRNVSISGGINTKKVFYSGPSKRLFEDKQFNYGEITLSGSNQLAKARQHIYPRFAQTLTARYRSILNKYTGRQFLITGALYFPGLGINHSLVLQGAYQFRDTLQQYAFSNSFPFSRGYTAIDFPRMWKLGANYHFPIAYPDVGFGQIVYLLRVRGNIFYDYTRTKSLRSGREYPFNTVGGEIYFDSKWWNQLPVSFGIRYSHLLNTDIAGRSASQWEFVLPVNLLSR
ncbi:MAG: hypothetical protein ABI687_08790 [Flavitalea sp.]